MDLYRVDKLMAEARRLAADYRRETGRTLAISGEIAVSDALNLLELEPAPEDATGYDAVRLTSAGEQRIQIKARVIFDPRRRSGRLGQLRLDQAWDRLLLVIMDENYEAQTMVEAGRDAVEQALNESAPNRRGTLTVARLQRIGETVWERPS